MPTERDDELRAFMEQNRRNWDDRAALHAQPTLGYALDRFRDVPTLLSDVVDFDRRYLGSDLTGLEVLHLQCHIGTDTLSLARLGASVTGLDQSGASLDAARELFASVDTAGTFVEANVYDAVDALGGQRFDLVYTGIGALNWLPDVRRWGQVVGQLVGPGGRLYLRDGHPMAYAIDDTDHGDGVLRLRYPYFETAEPMTFDDPATYVDTAGEQITNARHHEWNHGLGDVVMAVIDAGLDLRVLDEHRFLDWWMIPGHTERDGVYWLPEEQRDLCPMEYSLLAERPGDVAG